MSLELLATGVDFQIEESTDLATRTDVPDPAVVNEILNPVPHIDHHDSEHNFDTQGNKHYQRVRLSLIQ